LDSYPGDWRVVAFSTPETVYRDLQGTRKIEQPGQVMQRERRALAAIGRSDRLDPSLERRS